MKNSSRKNISPRQLQNLKLQNEAPMKKTEKGLLGIDYGEKFCGLAFSPDGICILPLDIIPTKNLFSLLPGLLNKKCIQKVILGLPLLPDGTENSLCTDIKVVGERISSLLPVEYINERFSSKSVLPSPKKNERIDDLSAVRILEFYLGKAP